MMKLSRRDLDKEACWLGLIGDDFLLYTDKPHRFVQEKLVELAFKSTEVAKLRMALERIADNHSCYDSSHCIPTCCSQIAREALKVK